MLGTKDGRAFVGRYMAKGQKLVIGGETYTFNQTGDRAKDVLWIRSSDMGNYGMNRTFTKDNKELDQIGSTKDLTEGVNQVIDLKIGLSEKRTTMTLGHEAFVHADKDADKLINIDKNVKEGGYSDIKEYMIDVYNVSNSRGEDHKALGEGKVVKFKNYSNELSKHKNDSYYKKEYERQVDQY